MSHKTSVLPFPKHDVKAAPSINLEGDDLVAWIEVDAQTPVMQHLSEKDIPAFVKNEKTNR